MGRWQEIDHTADLALHIWADDLADLFATAARGMFALITEVEAIPLVRERTLTLEAPDVEMLLVDWLNELLYLNEAEGVAYVAFEFAQIAPTHLRATLRGGPVAVYVNYVKAATFHNLRVRRTGAAGYETEIVFDT